MRSEYLLGGLALAVGGLAGLGYAVKRATGGNPAKLVEAVLGDAGKKLAARYAPGTDTPSPLGEPWSQYGSRSELRGAPLNTILAVKGLEKLSNEARALILDIAESSKIPVDSLVVVLGSESGFNPKAAYKLPSGEVFAAGLFQLTRGANLAGFGTKEAIASVLDMTAEEQLEKIAKPYFERFKLKSPVDPGKMYMLNFMPEHASKADSHVLGVKDDRKPEFVGKALPEGHKSAPSEWLTYSGKVYAMNKGFDPGEKMGVVTVGMVKASARAKARAPKGKRITVDGKILEAGKAGAVAGEQAKLEDAALQAQLQGAALQAELKAAAVAQPPKAAPAAVEHLGAVVYLDDSATGRLFEAVVKGLAVEPMWKPIVWDGLTVHVMTDALQAPVWYRHISTEKSEVFEAWRKAVGGDPDVVTKLLVRLPVSYADTIAICRQFGAVPYIKELWDHVWKLADVKIQPNPLPSGKLMGSVGYSLIHDHYITTQGANRGALVRDPGKTWLLHNRIAERGAVNYGWIVAKGSFQIGANTKKPGDPLQSVGGVHGPTHVDYSQTFVAVKRYATGPAGDKVDLLDHYAAKGIERRWLDAFR